MRTLVFALAACSIVMLSLTPTNAQVIFSDNFDSYTPGDIIGGPNWGPKWDGNDETQRNLVSAEGTGAGYAILDTSIASRNYHVAGKTGFFLEAGDTVNVSADVRYFHDAVGNITANLNSRFFELQLSDTPNWWNGANNSVSLGNRGPALGTPLPAAPWVDNWAPHGTLGVDTAAGGFSEWININWELTISDGSSGVPAGNIQGEATITPEGLSGATPFSTPLYDLGYTPGQVLYAGFSTGWNNGGADAISVINAISEVNIDNYQIEGGTLAGTPGDFDGDTDVDGSDFLKWQQDGLSAGDLSEWDGNYPTPLSGFSAAAVPEPSAITLCLVSAAMAGGMLRKRS